MSPTATPVTDSQRAYALWEDINGCDSSIGVKWSEPGDELDHQVVIVV